MRAILILLVLLAGCRHQSAGNPDGTHKDSAFAVAGDVSHAAGATERRFRIAPLRPMSGDVEVLSGDPEKAGEPFVMRIHELPGTMIPLHSHPVDENITIVQGTWYFAVGTVWDKAALTALHAGDYAFAPKGSTMYGYCPDGAIVQVHGIGPFVIHWAHDAKTLDDAAAAFTFRKGERVTAPRGEGVIRQGYASGEIVQYEIEGTGGARFMANQAETQRLRAPD